MLAEQKVYKAIKSVFADFAVLGRESLAANWKVLSKKSQYEAGRAQVFLRSVLRNPQDYFSRVATGRVWGSKIREYQKKGGYKSEDRDAVAFIVGGPAKDVDMKIRPLFVKNSKLMSEFRDFTDLVQRWEYKRTSKKKSDREEAQNIAATILEVKEKIENRKNKDVNRFVFWEMWKNIKRTFGH